MSERYTVVKDIEGCKACGHGDHFTVVDTVTDTQISTSWEDQEHTEEICAWMNEAYEAGRKDKR